MKLNENQIETIDTVLSIIHSWKNTNDINSPTHGSDINEELRKLNISEEHSYEIKLLLIDLLLEIIEIE